MQAARNYLTIEPPSYPNSTTSKSETWNTVEVLEDLLAHSIRLRDIYKNARWQTTDAQCRRLRQLFESHYQEQIQLVDVLVDRIRSLDGAGRIFAGDFLQRAPLRPGRASTNHLLVELIDAHESVLTAALPSGAEDCQVNGSWTRDFAVGQVVLTNDLQIHAVREQLLPRDRMPRTHPAWTERD